MKTILALDISTSCTGYTVINSENAVLDIDYINLSKYNTLYDKAGHVKSVLTEVVKKYNIDCIAVEENLQAFRPGLSSAKTLMTLAQFNGVVRWICFEAFNIEPVSINVNAARKAIGLKVDKKLNASTKEQVLAWVTNEEPDINWPVKEISRGRNKGQLQLESWSYDMADSYVIGRAFIVENC